ncbi:hypothetical protein [Streptosporangium amethystogenes]|uniref:hypothetical protein n=1 Tax=Streptosporangium amethystogenes TaxID=2002 RepID=UPI0012F86E4B|nr:hypothetical protein [Streptosporangium amethystogenes]
MSFLLADGIREDISRGGFRRSDHVGMDAERDGRGGMAEPGGDDVDGDARQSRGGRAGDGDLLVVSP